MKDGQLLRIKIIKTGDDLPKEDGEYFVLRRQYINRDSPLCYYKEALEFNSVTKDYWLAHIAWYLQPVEEQESKQLKLK